MYEVYWAKDDSAWSVNHVDNWSDWTLLISSVPTKALAEAIARHVSQDFYVYTHVEEM